MVRFSPFRVIVSWLGSWFAWAECAADSVSAASGAMILTEVQIVQT